MNAPHRTGLRIVAAALMAASALSWSTASLAQTRLQPAEPQLADPRPQPVNPTKATIPAQRQMPNKPFGECGPEPRDTQVRYTWCDCHNDIAAKNPKYVTPQICWN